jgi:hypothetical protein
MLPMAKLEKFRKRPAIGFSDCMMLEVARKAGHLPLRTFDRILGKLEGAETAIAERLTGLYFRSAQITARRPPPTCSCGIAPRPRTARG